MLAVGFKDISILGKGHHGSLFSQGFARLPVDRSDASCQGLRELTDLEHILRLCVGRRRHAGQPPLDFERDRLIRTCDTLPPAMIL